MSPIPLHSNPEKSSFNKIMKELETEILPK